MTRGVPVNPKTRERILKLHADGVSRNEIARKVGVSTGVVSRIVKAAGGTFKRASATKEATEARAADWSDLREQLAREMHAVAMQETKRARSPYVVHAFGGKENDYNEHTLDLPPADAVRQMQTTAAMAFDKATKLAEGAADGGAAEGKAMLVALGKAFGVIPDA
ncbi:helix-turn-helix domain-containing protein [Microbacterium sp. KR10-403]|uniref:helix-turn-helix domain-containing protein n=1 Tax=Microbacterium sp. KR10-403 TaxID=3158581 RepID=UPI0032E4D3CC